jgi:hypothetical protein
MATGKYLTIVTVLRDGSHMLYQVAGPAPGHAGVRIGAHIAVRRQDYGEELAAVVVIHGDVVAEHRP